jgi:hypothetical protein
MHNPSVRDLWLRNTREALQVHEELRSPPHRTCVRYPFQHIAKRSAAAVTISLLRWQLFNALPDTSGSSLKGNIHAPMPAGV